MAPLAYRLLADARPGDRFLAWEVVPDGVAHAWGAGDAVVWIAPSAYHGKAWLTGMGAAPTAGALAAEALASPVGAAFAGVSLPEGALERVPDRYRPQRTDHWTWWCVQQPPAQPADPCVVPIAAHDDRLPSLLQQSGSVYLLPGDPRVESWFGLVAEGSLRACLAVERHHPRVPHLASVAVDAPQRRRGYGARLCGTVVTRLLQAGAPAVSLAMMTDNRAAAALYRGLGFVAGPSFVSGTIPGRRGLPPGPGWTHPAGAS